MFKDVTRTHTNHKLPILNWLLKSALHELSSTQAWVTVNLQVFLLLESWADLETLWFQRRFDEFNSLVDVAK